MNEDFFWSDYYTDQYYQQNPNPQPAKKTFWESGFGTGLSNLWQWVTNNPQQVVNLVDKKQATDPYLANGYGTVPYSGYVGGNVNGGNNNPNQSSNSTVLVLLGIGVVVVLILLFKK